MAQVIDGKALALSIKSGLKTLTDEMKIKYGRTPCLAVVIVGDDPASRSYVRGKVKAAEFTGIESILIDLPETVTEKRLLDEIAKLNSDGSIDGILVQLPLPAHIDKAKIINGISIDKDVDGFHPQNVSKLWLGQKCTIPCTPRGIMAMIDSTGTEIQGKRAVVVGRSDIVGKPIAKLLLDRNATVTLAHSRTSDLAAVCREADILVVAAGCPGLVNGEMVKEGALVIDVGISHTDAGLRGDVDFESVSPKAAFISPVPGGVGPMTIAMLMANTVERALDRWQKD